MKKILLVLSAFLISNYSFAQWTTSGSNISYNAGDVLVDSTNPLSLFQVGLGSNQTNMPANMLIFKNTVIGNTAGLYSYISEHQEFCTSNVNVNRLQTTLYRRIAGATWQGIAYRLQFAVDNSFTDGSKAYIEIGAGDPNTTGGGFIAFGTAGSDRLVVTNAGGVGIGTTNPNGYMLAVNGSAIATSFNVKAYANWPDYVFKSDYHLPTLTDLKNYIDQNHHLPDVPSAEQVAKDGLNLGDMNRLLMQKTEELTIYLIQKDEKINQQQKQLDTQEAEIKKLEAAVQKLIEAKTKNQE